jgi:hypothetical protein
LGPACAQHWSSGGCFPFIAGEAVSELTLLAVRSARSWLSATSPAWSKANGLGSSGLGRIVPLTERQAITSQVRAWAPEVVSRKPRPVTIPAGVRLTGPLSGPDHRHRSAPSRTLITPCRPPSSCKNHTWTACSQSGRQLADATHPIIPARSHCAGRLHTDQAMRPQVTDRAAKKVLWHICGTQE